MAHIKVFRPTLYRYFILQEEEDNILCELKPMKVTVSGKRDIYIPQVFPANNVVARMSKLIINCY